MKRKPMNKGIKKGIGKGINKADKLRQQRRDSIKDEKRALKAEKNQPNVWIPTGSVMFNLACSDQWYGGFKAGTMVNSIGDSSSGKSIQALSGIAEAFYMGQMSLHNSLSIPDFRDFRLIYDDSEYANSFDMPKLFGPDFAEIVEGPDRDNPDKFSTTIEEFEDNLYSAIEDGQPFIYIQDSFDAIDADAEKEKAKKNRDLRKQGKDTKGSFQATKQKSASSLFRRITEDLKKTNSLLNIISQTRDNLNALSFAAKYRSGGRALKFYASIESWLTYVGSIDRTLNGNKYRIGVKTRAKIEKNKYTGKKRDVDFPIYYDYGVDDIGACIDFLIKSKYWGTRKKTIIADELGLEMPKPKLMDFIDSANSKKKWILKRKLFQTTQDCWDDIEKQLKLNRGSKF